MPNVSQNKERKIGNGNELLWKNGKRPKKAKGADCIQSTPFVLRKVRDSNPRYPKGVYRISSPAHSVTLPTFLLRLQNYTIICEHGKQITAFLPPSCKFWCIKSRFGAQKALAPYGKGVLHAHASSGFTQNLNTVPPSLWAYLRSSSCTNLAQAMALSVSPS